jgi:hypothetical protein
MQRHQRWRIWKAEADVELLRLVPPAASANCDAASVERFKLKALAAEASWRQLQLDKVREVPLIHVPGDRGLATAHLAQSSSASRFMAGASEFFILSQSGERPEREREILPLRARPRTKIELQRTEKCRQWGPWRAGYPPIPAL